MDADTIRLLLFLAGIALILGIYFWDRAKKRPRRSRAQRPSRREPSVSLDDATVAPPPADQEPRITDTLWEGLGGGSDTAPEEKALHDALEELDDLVRDERPAPEPSPREAGGEQAGAGSDLPQMILQLNVVARSGVMFGSDIERSVREAGLVSGEPGIFHRHAGDGDSRVLYSLANLVEPGTFPLGQMDGFSTPGIVLFAQLPGPVDPMTVFEQMLESARFLTTRLGGELQDASHSDLSQQTIEHIREEIMEYKRRLRLAELRR
ncbi:MAG TPA: hypothetical protein ENK50_06720 [Sedimenticola sp.]|nr:hypothetical protein [Sedimenticola sp.]